MRRAHRVGSSFIFELGVVTVAGLTWRAISPLVDATAAAIIGPALFWGLAFCLDPMSWCSNYSMWRGRSRCDVLGLYLIIVVRSAPFFIATAMAWGVVVGLSPSVSICIGLMTAFLIQADETVFEPSYQRLALVPRAGVNGIMRGLIYGMVVVGITRSLAGATKYGSELAAIAWMMIIVSSWSGVMPRRMAVATRNATSRDWLLGGAYAAVLIFDSIVIYGASWSFFNYYAFPAAPAALIVATFVPYFTGGVLATYTKWSLAQGPIGAGVFWPLSFSRRWWRLASG